MRVFLLRVLISWWFIPLSVFLIPVFYLIGDVKLEAYKELVKIMWYGDGE